MLALHAMSPVSGMLRPWADWRRVIALLCLIAGLLAPLASAAGSYSEAPVLADRVAKGALPSVDKRLPRNPMLIQPEETLGRYGGTLHLVTVGRNDGLMIYRHIEYEPLLRWDAAWRRLVPNVAQSYKVNDSATEFTFKLRPGMRWSDGEPFTAEDIRFWYEDVLTNAELTPRNPGWLHVTGRPARLDVLDPYTIRFVFATPSSLFPTYLAVGSGDAGPTEFPRHALARYHRRHNPDGIAAEVEAHGAKDWTQLFWLKARGLKSISDAVSLLRLSPAPEAITGAVEGAPIPTLNAWWIRRYEPGTPPKFVAERNPYYWKIDPAGHQLPYIDRVELLQVDQVEDVLQLALDGRIDLDLRYLTRAQGTGSLADVEKTGKYRSVKLLQSESNQLALVFNLTHPDAAKRALLGNREFRIALSLAVDRKAIIERAFNGTDEPYQTAPRPESRYFSAQLARQFIAYSPVEANARLDGMGLAARDGDGMRLSPDGRRVGLTITTRKPRAHEVEALNMIIDYWRAVGIEANLLELDRSAANRAMRKGQFDIGMAPRDGGVDALIEAYMFVPVTDEAYYAPAWAQWFSNPGEAGAEEPPPAVRQQIDLYLKLRETVDTAAQEALMEKIIQIAADQFYMMGISLPAPREGIVGAHMRNVPKVMVEAWAYPTPAPTNPCQYFIASP